MKKFDGIMICTDLDGTLLRNDKSISSENISAIEYFKSEGGLFTFVTGRMPFFVSDIYETIRPNAPFGCINGGGLYDYIKQQYIWTRTLDIQALKLVEFAEQNIPQIGFQINTFEKVYFCKDNAAMEEFREVTKLPDLKCHYKDVKEPMAKIVLGDTDEKNINDLAELLNSHPDAGEFDFIRSEKTLYEILPKGINKGTVLEKMAELLNVDIDRTVAVGDYNNDIPMMKRAGLGIAVSNAVDDAKKAADHITVSNEQHAIAKIIDDIDSGNLIIAK